MSGMSENHDKRGSVLEKNLCSLRSSDLRRNEGRGKKFDSKGGEAN